MTERRKRKPNKQKEHICACGTSFLMSRAPHPGKAPKCKRCTMDDHNARARKAGYYKRPVQRQSARAWSLRTHYGLTLEKYEEMRERQGGVCGICKKPEPRGNLAVDHDHATGTVRGLLCHKCNQGIGLLGESTSVLQQATGYLLQAIRGSWDEYFINFARLAATRSKDESSRVGAVLVKDRVILATGYNGFPRGVNDNVPERRKRPEKYLWTVHAEENCILNAVRIGIPTAGATLYVTPLSPCVECAKAIITAGVTTVIVDAQQQENPRFRDSFAQAEALFAQCGVTVRAPE